jgi:hypothetical protein
MKQEVTTFEIWQLYECDREARRVFNSRINNAVRFWEINAGIDMLKIGVSINILLP